ncbi:MAG: NUDIX domain-containing protein [Alphaproteobacteria bacterium]
MIYFWRILARIWRLGGRRFRWRVLWLLNPTFFVGGAGVVLDDAGRILLLQPRFWRAGSWGIPGGIAKRGETLEQTFAREVREETGLEIGDIALVRVVSSFRLHLEIHFCARVTGGTLVLDRSEILAGEFFAPDNLPEGLKQDHRETIRIALER